MNQSKIIKWVIALALFLLTILLGFYFSGYIILVMFKFQTNSLSLRTYYNYFTQMSNPQVLPFVGKIKTAGTLGFGAVFLPWVIIGLFRLGTKAPSIHGDAKFADNGDLSKADFFKSSETSLVVGKKNGELLYLSGQQFAILAAPTRSGKGVGIVVPNLLTYQGS